MRDLPQGAKQIPAEYKSEPWSNLGVNVNDNFTPIYIIPPGKSKQIKLLKDRLKSADGFIWRRTRTARAKRSVGTS